ncbi:ATP-binding protein [Paraburkholderia acidipaludis]|uniref:ATP-binding protein n=1 Tax=Paraburkholderia acidipaludis TaxID=660537 RepID=UPI000482A6FA|nr:ATP-binding protein [Paraburkholderia acidipaludis]
MISLSIRHRLSSTILCCVTLVWLVAVYGCFRNASREVQEWEDARLVEYAALIVHLSPTDLNRFAHFPLDARVELDASDARHAPTIDSDRLPRDILFEVRDASGAIVTSSLPQRIAAMGGPRGTFREPVTLSVDGTPWRAYALVDRASGRAVWAVEPSNTRSDLATGTAHQIVWPLIVALPILALLLWYAIGRSLAPLKTLSTTIRARDAQSLEPTGMDNAPTEVRALVDALDRLLAQLRQSIARERTFTSDAAHELKTPLAAIKVQAQVALASDNPETRRLAMKRVVQGVDRSARLAEQLLLLARLDEYERIPAQVLASGELIKDAVDRHIAHASEKGIDITVALGSAKAIRVDAVLFGILLDNLIDNAVKYGNINGKIAVSTYDCGTTQCLAVRDDGPGVARGECARLTDRFFRGTATQSPGSGLGLSIVERITRYFGGTLRFEPGLSERGLAVVVAFPALDSPTSEMKNDSFARDEALRDIRHPP